MRGRRLNILAAISLTCLAVLLCGYFASIGPLVSWCTPINAQTATLHICGARLDRGRCWAFFMNGPITMQAANTSTHYLDYRVLQFGWPKAGPSLWEFQSGRPPNGGFELIFPIWCLALPCTIAPVLWWRRRRRRTGRGFAVEVQAAGR